MRKKALLLLLALLLAVLPCALAEETVEPSAFFLNVGKADAALVFVDGRAYMIDTGSKDSADDMLAALDALGVSRLDAVFVTHTHKDHVGGLAKLLKRVAVDQLYAPRFSVYESDANHPVAKKAEKYDIPLRWLLAGDEIAVSDSASFRVLGPMTRYESSENNNSLVLLLTTARGTLLFSGDMCVEEENELLRNRLIPHADVYKVAHHGEDDASSERLVAAVSPSVAVISTSVAEKPETASPVIVGFFRDIGADVLVTQEARVGIRVSWRDGGWVAERVN